VHKPRVRSVTRETAYQSPKGDARAVRKDSERQTFIENRITGK